MTRGLTRRMLLLRAAQAAAVAGPVFRATAGQANVSGAINRNSAPSGLKITDMRACRVAANYDFPIIRIDTNQGVYGLGEVFPAGVEGIALILKAHVAGRNPLDIPAVLRTIRPFAGHGRMGGGYSAVDMALHDIAGKVYNVPAHRLVGAKRRDRVRIYADTTSHRDLKIYAARMARRKAMGITYFKMDLQTSLVSDRPGAVNERGVATPKGLQYLCEYIQAIRDVIGWAAPLAADHFGPLSVKDAIAYARAFEPYQLSWAEDFIDWRDWEGFKKITDASTTPTLTGENAFGLEEGFKPLIDNAAINIVQPDPAGSGGLAETKLIADYAAMRGIPTVLHNGCSPVGTMAMVHIAATLSNFVALENHSLDMPWWQDLVTGVPKPLIKDGYQAVPELPGLGVELDDAVVQKHLRRPGYFEPTPMFDDRIVSGYFVSGGWPHVDAEGVWCDNCTSDR